MALKIRLRRMGRKKAPTYRIVVAESSMPRDGRFVENLGHYNPRTEPVTLVVKRDRALAWMEKGAVPTDTVNSLLKKAGVYGEPTVVEAATEAVADATETVKKAAKKTATATKATATKATKAVKEKAEEAAETVKEAAEDVKEKVAKKAEPETDAEAEADAPEASEEAEKPAAE